MRKIAIKWIISRYLKGYDEVTCNLNIDKITFTNPIDLAKWLESLSDEDLLNVFDSQCCQIYR